MRGCTPQSCAFRDHHAALVELGADVFGVSTQKPDDQKEFAERLGLRFPVLSDAGGVLERELGLPAVEVVPGVKVYKRVTIVAEDHR